MTTPYRKAYFCAYAMAQLAEVAYQFARNDDTTTFLGPAYKITGRGMAGRSKHFDRALAQLRRARKTAVLSRITGGDTAVLVIVANVYRGIDPALTNAAASSVRAHIKGLVEQGSPETNLSEHCRRG